MTTFTLVETYDDTSTVLLGGRSFPVRSLLEDEHGLRWLLHDDDQGIRAADWIKAASAGVVAILVDRGAWTGAMTIESFMDGRSEVSGGGLVFPEWAFFDHLPTYQELVEYKPVPVESSTQFVHLHTHTEYSSLDGLSFVSEIVQAAVADGQTAIAVTDHGTPAGHPDLQQECDKAGIKPIFGLEAYLVDDRLSRPEPGNAESVKSHRDYYHLSLWAEDDEGLLNLWAMSTEAERDGKYYKPRLDWDTLRRYRKGVMVGTGCLRGPLSHHALLDDDESAARMRLSRLMEIFGEDVYVEIHTNQLPEQVKVNCGLVKLAREHGLPMIAAVDSHYAERDHQYFHRVWLSIQTDSDVADDSSLFAGQQDYHLATEAEVREALAYLGEDVVEESIVNTARVAERCTARIQFRDEAPVFSREGGHDRDAERLLDMCLDAWHKTEGKRESFEVYEARFRREYDLLVQKNFCGYFLMVADYCLDPSTPVLTEDMRWVEVGKLEVGDRLAGFDEHKVVKQQKGHRYWRSAEVVNTRRIVLPTYKITLADGTETITSEDHQWLVGSPSGGAIRWIRTRDLKVGQRPQRLVSEWDEPDTWEAGYIAGILDGEGSLSLSKMNNGGRSLSLGFAQKEGVVLDTALKILDSWGFTYSLKDHGAVRNGLRSVWISGGRAEVMRLLGMARPQSLLAKLDMDLLGRVISIASPSIVSIEPLGLGEVVALETTTGTLVAQGFAHHNCRWARQNKILVGPGRGSGGGSLVAYLIGITGLDPVEADLLFERFMTEGRTSLPDFDVDFPASKKRAVQRYVMDRWGEDHTAVVGSVIRLKNRGVVDNCFKALKSTLPPNYYVDQRNISKLIEAAEANTAGLGMPWEELWAKHGDVLGPYRESYPEVFAACDVLVGRAKTYGQHAAGMVISTGTSLNDRLPMRRSKDEERMVSQFDMRVLEELGYIKADILTLRNLDTLQDTIDLIRERRGVEVDFDVWRDEYRDPQVWEEISAGHTLGIFQIETPGGTRMTKRMQPRSMDELADAITLVRPGPKDAGLTETYLRRRAGEEEVSYPDPRLAAVLESTHGAMIYQEQIMAACMILAGYDSNEADGVRKILGKKLVEKVVKAGEEFTRRAVEHGMDAQAAQNLWAQMAEFAKYSFNRAHAYAYAVLGYWCAWLKFHYPVEFLTAALSTVDKEAIPSFIKEARRMGFEVRPPSINESGKTFTASPLAVRYGFTSIKSIGDAVADAILPGQPYESWDDFLARKGKGCNSGHIETLARIGAFDELVPNRRGLETLLAQQKDGTAVACTFKNLTVLGPNGLPCTYDWDSEPDPVNARTGKKTKRKPIPRKCTKACRQYSAPPLLDIDTIEPYTADDIRDIEAEILGVYLSSTPFDKLDPEDRELLLQQAEILSNDDAPNGLYLVGALVGRVKPHTASSGQAMGFVGLETEVSLLDCVVFSREWGAYRRDLVTGRLAIAEVEKTSRGFTLQSFMPIV